MIHKQLIYTLADPNGYIKYVGKTTDASSRMSAHLRDKSNSPKGIWVRELKKQGKDPVMDIIDEETYIANGLYSTFNLETFYINLFTSWGFILFNKVGTPYNNKIIANKIKEGHKVNKDFRKLSKLKNLLSLNETLIKDSIKKLESLNKQRQNLIREKQEIESGNGFVSRAKLMEVERIIDDNEWLYG
jgi:hypothetical protein